MGDENVKMQNTVGAKYRRLASFILVFKSNDILISNLRQIALSARLCFGPTFRNFTIGKLVGTSHIYGIGCWLRF